MAWVIRGNLKGPTGTIDQVTSAGLPAGATPVITLGGTPAHRIMNFGIPKGDKGDQGLPGFEAVPTDAGVAQLVTLPSATKSALDASFSRKFHVNVLDHGAVGDFNGTVGTDNLAAFTAALAACAVGGTLFVPPGRYYFSDTFVLDKCVDFTCGRGGFASNSPGTQLVFAAGKGGIWGKKNAGGIRPSGARIGAFEIQSLSTAAGADIGVLLSDGQMTLDFTTVNGFGSHGVALQAGVNSPYTTGNVNNSYLNRVRAYGNRGDGILLQGNDSQAHILIKPDVVANYGWGINADRTAQNVIDAPHADQSLTPTGTTPLGAFRDNGSGNMWRQAYSEAGIGMLIDTNSNFANITTTQYGRPIITDTTVGKTALRMDVEQGTYKQSILTGVFGTRAALDLDGPASGVSRFRQILNAGVAASKDIWQYAAGSNTFAINAPIRVNGTVNATPVITSGTGTPEAVVPAPIGSIYMRIDGGAGTSIYVKQTGAATSAGWVGK